MKYPRVLSERDTLALAKQTNISRFGDGELRLAVGKDCVSQRERFPAMVAELKSILKTPRDNCLVCIPNVAAAPSHKRDSWNSYADPKYVSLYSDRTYGSAFITRPDSAPWIDTDDYWEEVRKLWIGKDVCLVVGDKKSVTTEMIGSDASSVREVLGPRQNAYGEIDRIEEEIGTHAGAVLMCMGVTATILAWRLALRGVHAVDLGHIGMFMRHAGAYRYSAADLLSPDYKKQITQLHRTTKWGRDGSSHLPVLKEVIEEHKPNTILDYGCGQGTLAAALAPTRVMEYDPGIAGKDQMPKPAELVVCTDVLEHIEPNKLDSVLDHIRRLTGKVAYLVIATRPARAILPDGRNAHLIIQDHEWWTQKLLDAGFKILSSNEVNKKSLKVLVSR